MHKVLAEIIAGLIPHKMTRNRWRGILRYGLVRAWQLKRRMQGHLPCTRHYLAVCAIAKDEGPYFREWVEWHLKQGVEKFYIYDNGSTDCTKVVLQPYVENGIVEYTYFPGYRRQLAAYDDCLERHRLDTRWLAFIDLDEFIVPVKDDNIAEFLHRHEDAAAVEVNWLVYGSGGAQTRQPGTMMERFRHHARPEHPLNRWVKSIVDPRRVFDMIGCHQAAVMSGTAIDSHGQQLKKHFRDREPQLDIIRINHYAVRSYEEFIEKQMRGRASGRYRSVPRSYFDKYDLNDVED